MTKEIKILLGLGILGVLLVIFAAVFFGGSPETQTAPVDESVLIKSSSHSIGSESASVTLVEFGDYQCPACGAAYPIVKQINQEYQGKLRFIFRNFPLVTIHKNAMIAAEAAEAAGGQGKFWEMHDVLFERQGEWADSDNPMEYFEKYAKDLGLDVDKFKKEIEDGKYRELVVSDQNDGNTLGVNATPTFFVNNQKIDIPSYENIKSKIESQLSN